MKYLSFLKFAIVSTFMVLGTMSAISQAPPPTPPSPYHAQGIPVDGGITILAAAGIGLGIKKIKDARKNSNPECQD